MCDVAEGVCSWCRPRKLLEEIACKQNQEGSEESASWKSDRVEGLEGKSNVLSFKNVTSLQLLFLANVFQLS